MTVRPLAALTLTLLAGLIACFFYVKPAKALPPGFQDTSVADVPLPTALDFTPDGRTLVTSKPGQLYAYENGQTNQVLNLGPKVCSNSERGLLGVAVDPQFGTSGNNYVYVYYTWKKYGECPEKNPADPHIPVSRFTMDGDTVDPDSEKIFINNIHSPNGNHNGGDVHFGNDGDPYVSVGDGGCDYAEPTKCQYENDARRSDYLHGDLPQAPALIYP